jgi:hypothetical protein
MLPHTEQAARRQNRHHVAETAFLTLILSLRHRTPLGQPRFRRGPSPENNGVVPGEEEG